MGQLNSIDLPDPGTRSTVAAVPSKSRWWLWALVLGVVALGGWYYHNSRNASQAADAASPGAAGKGKGGFGVVGGDGAESIEVKGQGAALCGGNHARHDKPPCAENSPALAGSSGRGRDSNPAGRAAS